MSFKDLFFASSSGSHSVQWSKTILASLVSELPRQHSYEVRLKLAKWCRRSYHLKSFLFLTLAAIMFIGAEKYYLFGRESYSNIPVKFD